MIQRIQSLYLALVTSIGILLFFVPFSVFIQKGLAPEADSARMLKLTAITRSTGEKTETTAIPYFLILANLLVMAMATYILLNFKNRKRQLLFGRILMIFICLFVGLVFWYGEQLKTPGSHAVTYLSGTYLPVIQLILTYLAARAIKKDEDLVRSADRLR